MDHSQKGLKVGAGGGGGGATGISGAGAASWVGTGVSAAGGEEGRSQKGRRWEQEEAAGVLQEFREQVQVPGLEQEYLQQEGLDRSQKGRRWEQEAEEGMPQEFGISGILFTGFDSPPSAVVLSLEKGSYFVFVSVGLEEGSIVEVTS